MTVIKTFECNFCRSGLDDAGRGRGLAWSNSGLQWEGIEKAGIHLCDNCAKHMFELFKRTPSMSPEVAGS